jgi:hypothetical protein
MITELFANAEYWHWAVAGLVLLILEMLAPGAIFMWLGIAAFVVSALLALMPSMGWEIQWFIFGLFSIVSIIAWRMFFKKHPLADDDEGDHLNQRGREMIGRKLKLSQAIENGSGRTQIGDSWWRVEGPDLEAGTKVIITDSKGSSVVVKAVKI